LDCVIISFFTHLSGEEPINTFQALESKDKQLQNLENVQRKPQGLIELESLSMEGTKPI